MSEIVSAVWNEAGTMIRVELEDGIVMWVPDDMVNRHRVELEEWVDKGNEIAAYTPEAFV